MKNTKLVVAVGAGYLLGRMHKARWALALAGLAAGKKLTTNGGELLEGLMDSSPQLRELADTVRGDLAGAGRKAVAAAASRKVDALTERLEGGTSALRKGGRDDEDSEFEEPEDVEQDDDQDDDEDAESERGSRSARRSRTESKSKSKSTSTRSPSRAPAKKTTQSRSGAAAKRSSSGTARKSTGTRSDSTRKRG